jgi:hypothetical protein
MFHLPIPPPKKFDRDLFLTDCKNWHSEVSNYQAQALQLSSLFSFRQGIWTVAKPALGPTQPLTLRMKWPGLEADQSVPYNA